MAGFTALWLIKPLRDLLFDEYNPVVLTCDVIARGTGTSHTEVLLETTAVNAQKVLIHFMLALLFTHKLDAATQSEWRLLYVLRTLSDEQGRWWFVALHVPLFFILTSLTNHSSERVQRWSRTVLALFCIIHALLHWRLCSDPLSTFHSPASWGWILGPAVLGVTYLWMTAQFFRVKKSLKQEAAASHGSRRYRERWRVTLGFFTRFPRDRRSAQGSTANGSRVLPGLQLACRPVMADCARPRHACQSPPPLPTGPDTPDNNGTGPQPLRGIAVETIRTRRTLQSLLPHPIDQQLLDQTH